MSRGGSVGLVDKNISSLVECSQFSLRIQVLALCAVSEYNNRKSTGRYEWTKGVWNNFLRAITSFNDLQLVDTDLFLSKGV